MSGTNDGVAFPMTHLFPRFNVQGSLAQRPSVGDLSSAISSAVIALTLLLLAAQALPKRPAFSLVRINMLINGFMADGQPRGNLLWTPLQAHKALACSFTQGATVLALRLFCARSADISQSCFGL